ncbi:MAG: peptide chain release factor 2 [Planctomycetes bacterium]|nr:peptide chain release factor 2 [Planctomycetota bacterium]
MSHETKNRLEEVGQILHRIKDATSFDAQSARLALLEQEMAKEGFWNDQERARRTIGELKRAKAIVEEIRSFERRWHDGVTLFELAVEEADAAALAETERDASALLHDALQLELRTLLSSPYDASNCFLSIHAGAGGTESCDWAQILRRMYLRYAERSGFRSKILEELPGEEAGIRSVTLYITGTWAYGYLRAEIGVHRLVRLSPFDAKNRRHTSFASVHVSPEVEDDIEVAIEDVDLRVDTYRSSGAGGQHVNVTDSAVRITHLPTGVVVQCQNERSQHSNRQQAMKVLRSRLLQLELQKRDEEITRMAGVKRKIDFGSQIRSYVLHPYKMVKDHRTEVETSNVDAVLDGDLEHFIEAFLRQSARGQSGQSGAAAMP